MQNRRKQLSKTLNQRKSEKKPAGQSSQLPRSGYVSVTPLNFLKNKPVIQFSFR
jgi:hypothetical protein